MIWIGAPSNDSWTGSAFVCLALFGSGEARMSSPTDHLTNGEAHSAQAVEECLQELVSGTEYRFSEWPNSTVPSVAAGVYTIWNDRTLIYVGMAGRSHTEESLARATAQSNYVTGLRSRLKSHASGRRSGDQFCVYVADRFILPTLSMLEVQAIGLGELSLDALVRKHIHELLSYRFVVMPSGRDAHELERMIRQGALHVGQPILNPLSP